jgi:hypothetical protein
MLVFKLRFQMLVLKILHHLKAAMMMSGTIQVSHTVAVTHALSNPLAMSLLQIHKTEVKNGAYRIVFFTFR